MELAVYNNTNDYLDFNDMTFKSGGWLQKFATLVDIGNGNYSQTLDVTAITNLADTTDHLALEYTISGSVVGVALDMISFPVVDPVDDLTVKKFLSLK